MGPRSAGNPPPYSSTAPRPPDLEEVRRRRIQIAREETAAWCREFEKTMASVQSEILTELRQFRLEQSRPPPPPRPPATADPYAYQPQQPPPSPLLWSPPPHSYHLPTLSGQYPPYPPPVPTGHYRLLPYAHMDQFVTPPPLAQFTTSPLPLLDDAPPPIHPPTFHSSRLQISSLPLAQPTTKPPPLLDDAVSAQPNNSPASFCSVSGTNTSVSNQFNCHKDDCGMGFVFGATGNGEKLENGKSVEKRAEVTSGDGREFSELECVIAKQDEGGLVEVKEQLSNGMSEFHAIQLFDKMPKLDGLCNARRNIAAVMRIRDKDDRVDKSNVVLGDSNGLHPIRYEMVTNASEAIKTTSATDSVIESCFKSVDQEAEARTIIAANLDRNMNTKVASEPVENGFKLDGSNAKNSEYVRDDEVDSLEKEHSDGADDKENDVKQLVFDEKLSIFQSSYLSGVTVVSSQMHGLEDNLEADVSNIKPMIKSVPIKGEANMSQSVIIMCNNQSPDKIGASADVVIPQITKIYVVGFPEGHESYGKSSESLQVILEASDAELNRTTHLLGPDDNEKNGNCEGSGESGNHSRKGFIEENLVANPIVTVQTTDPYENQIYLAANLHKDGDARNSEKISACVPEDSNLSWNVNLVAACVKFGGTRSGRQMFDNILCSKVSSWNVILSGYVQNEEHMETLMFLCAISEFGTLATLNAWLNGNFLFLPLENKVEKMNLLLADKLEKLDKIVKMLLVDNWERWKYLVIAMNKNGTKDLHANFLENHLELFVKCLRYVMSTWAALYTMQKLGFKFYCQHLYQLLSSLTKLEGELEDLDRDKNINWERITKFYVNPQLSNSIKALKIDCLIALKLVMLLPFIPLQLQCVAAVEDKLKQGGISDMIGGDLELLMLLLFSGVVSYGEAFTSLELLQNECQIDQADVKAIVASAIIQLHLNKATELILSSGMRVCCKITDFDDDQVIFTRFSYGGLSVLVESEYSSCLMGPTIARDIGVYGYRPSDLVVKLACKRAKNNTKLGVYTRTSNYNANNTDQTKFTSWLHVDLRYYSPSSILTVTTFLLSVASVMCVTVLGVMITIDKAHIDEFAMKAEKKQFGIVFGLYEQKLFLTILLQHGIFKVGGELIDDGNFIAQLINSEHQTCPKSGQKVFHMVLLPNYALKSLLHQWCEENKCLVSLSRAFEIAFGGKEVHVSQLEGKRTVHNNVAEVIADIDGKLYDIPVIMQLVMVLSTRPMDEVKGIMCIMHESLAGNPTGRFDQFKFKAFVLMITSEGKLPCKWLSGLPFSRMAFLICRLVDCKRCQGYHVVLKIAALKIYLFVVLTVWSRLLWLCLRYLSYLKLEDKFCKWGMDCYEIKC